MLHIEQAGPSRIRNLHGHHSREAIADVVLGQQEGPGFGKDIWFVITDPEQFWGGEAG